LRFKIITKAFRRFFDDDGTFGRRGLISPDKASISDDKGPISSRFLGPAPARPSVIFLKSRVLEIYGFDGTRQSGLSLIGSGAAVDGANSRFGSGFPDEE